MKFKNPTDQPDHEPTPDHSPDVSLFKNGKTPKNPETKNFLEIYQETQTGVHKEKVERIRKLKKAFKNTAPGERAAKEKEWKQAKVMLPCFTASGTFRQRNNNSLLTHSGIIQGDIDGKDNLGKLLEEMRAVVATDPTVIAHWASPSGDGIKFFSRTSPDLAKHLGSFLSIEKHYADQGIKIDPSCKDVSRACFISCDPDAVFRPYEEAQEVEPIASPSAEPELEREIEPRDTGVSYPLEVAKKALEAIAKVDDRPDYDDWLKLISGMFNTYGEEGYAAAEEIFPEDTDGEYRHKKEYLLQQVTAGSVFDYAKKKAQWQPSRKQKKELACQLSEQEAAVRESPSDKIPKARSSFNPEGVFYSPGDGKFFVDMGSHYRDYSRKDPIKTGITRYLKAQGVPTKAQAALVQQHIADIEIDSAVDWTGSLAGYSRGLTEFQGKTALIIDGPDIIESMEGDCPMITSIIEQAFPKEEARTVFLGWLSDGVKAVKAGGHHPAPLMVLAGPVNSGKSLLALIVKLALGGRMANPMTAWSGKLPWNDNLAGSELLLIDDSQASADIRARKALGANFKEAIYGDDVNINTRNKSSMSVRPVWRAMICCNETPENLSVIPTLDEDTADKIILIKVSKVETPMRASNSEERKRFKAALVEEMPHFMRLLEKVNVCPQLSDSRGGVTAWKDPELLEALRGVSPEATLEGLVSIAMDQQHMLQFEQERWMAASEVEQHLKGTGSPVWKQANEILSFHTHCGRYLSALKKQKSDYVKDSRKMNGTTQYLMTRPGEVTEDDCF